MGLTLINSALIISIICSQFLFVHPKQYMQDHGDIGSRRPRQIDEGSTTTTIIPYSTVDTLSKIQEVVSEALPPVRTVVKEPKVVIETTTTARTVVKEPKQVVDAMSIGRTVDDELNRKRHPAHNLENSSSIRMHSFHAILLIIVVIFLYEI